MFWMFWNKLVRKIPCLKLLLVSSKWSVSLSYRVNFLLSAKQQFCWLMNWFTDDDVEEVGALHLCTRSLHQQGLWLAAGSPSLTSHWSNAPTLCVVSTPFLQNTILGSCSGLERCPSNLHTTSSSHIGYLIVSHFSHWLSLATWLPCWHDASTKVATHYTTKSPILLENHEYAVSCSCQWMKTFDQFKDFILLKIWTENVILLKNDPNLRIMFPKLIAMVTIKRTKSWMKLLCC